MIEFHLDARSGVPPYQQVVQQVRHALRLGLLDVGDQLPTVKEVVASLAINPNTVLKAYKELEHAGLVAARAGVGTFVTGTLRDASFAAQGPLRQSLQRWLGQARRAGRTRRASRRCSATSFALPPPRASRDRRRGGRRAGQAVRPDVGALGVHPGDPGRQGRRSGRPERRGEEHPVASGGGPAPGGHRVDLGPGWSSGRKPRRLARVGFVAQDTPTYAGMSVADHLRLGAWTNPGWDPAIAQERVERVGLDPGRKAGKLSGGQRAQLALTLAVAKRPELLILDEPVASLDPLARREFLQGLMEVVADHGSSVILSSHLVADLERVCDYLVVLVDSRVQIAGPIDELLAAHHRLSGPAATPTPSPKTSRSSSKATRPGRPP